LEVDFEGIDKEPRREYKSYTQIYNIYNIYNIFKSHFYLKVNREFKIK